MIQQPISDQLGQQLMESVQKLAKLNASAIVTPQSDALKKGITEFLQRALFEHADELVACWIAVHYEYEPLVGAFGSVIRRFSIMQAAMANAQAAAQAAQEGNPIAAAEAAGKPDNVVELPKAQ